MCDCSREDLLDEFEAASNTDIPLPIPEPAADEFEKIWSRIQEERAESADTTEQAGSEEPGEDKVIRVRFGWKRLAAIGLIACLIAGSGSIVAVGRKSYFFRERKDEIGSNGVVFNNDMNKVAVNGEEEAYALIMDKLEIKPLRLGFVPSEMSFEEMQMEDGVAYMSFRYKDDFLYFIQSKYNTEVSHNYKSDLKSEEENVTYNKWLKEDLTIRKEFHKDNKVTIETSIIIEGAFYRLVGTVEYELFQQMAEELTF
ncbi:hypothetical protein DWX59_24420 [Enterocloster aldenensis]|nr:hypothetical protein DWX59_24420 [Enterocloster aldenensis]